jgi:phosphosulfolactate phosphohydrolase-like enzyme
MGMFEEMGTARRRIVIDSFPESAVRYSGLYAVVGVDVLTASTTLLTSLAQGRRTFVAKTSRQAFELVEGLGNAILAGEDPARLSETPDGFELRDSPAALARIGTDERPLVLRSSPGSDLLASAARTGWGTVATYVSGLRNLGATAKALSAVPANVAIIGAGYHDEFSCEDQFACAKLAQRLMDLGYVISDLRSMEIVKRWCDADPSLIAWGNSAAALSKAGRREDVEFVLAHYDDLPFTARMRPTGELSLETATEAAARSLSRAIP